MAILSVSTDVLPFLRLSADDSYTTVATLTSSVEALASVYCDRILEAADLKEFYHGTDSAVLVLRAFPIQRINKITTVRRSVMRVWNTNVYTSATVEVISTGLVLKYNGSTTSGNFTFATNTTIDTLVTAINAAGSGWSAETISEFGTFRSDNLIQSPGRDAINGYRLDLDACGEGIDYTEVDKNAGIVYRGLSFYKGFNNIYVDYRAGYESGSIPADLKFALLTWIKDVYTRHMEDSISVSSYRIAGISKDFLAMPTNVKLILDRKYKNRSM